MYTDQLRTDMVEIRSAIADATNMAAKTIYTGAALVLTSALPAVRRLENTTLAVAGSRSGEVLEILRAFRETRAMVAQHNSFELAARKLSNERGW